ncbi:ABC transporter substrate-binding protein [Rugosimonospora acidiphila]|uniref:ABC transporter substrate-binding protein n=1 Tax=Rugosimonospora acidiphila TaxID=556531 RepID=A0ABP9SD92_9ACTN
MSWKLHHGAAIAAVALAMVAGCGVTAGAGSGSAGSDVSGRSLEVIGEWTGEEQANFQKVLNGFTARTHVKVTYTSGGNNVNILLNSRLTGGAPPDVALVPQPGVVAEYARKGMLVPLTGDAAAAVSTNYSDAWKQLGVVDGRLYGFFFKVANKSVVWYRTDDFRAAGARPPSTWDDFIDTSKTLADSGVTPIAVPAADGWPVTDWFENVYLRVAGSDKYAELAAHRLAWTDPTVVRALSVLGGYFGTPNMIEKGATQLTFTQAVADVFGERPKAAMLYEGDFVTGEIGKLGAARIGGDAKLFNFPSIDGSAPAVVSAGDEAVQFRDSPGARALMAYLASPEAARIWAQAGGFLSANSELDLSAYPDDSTRAMAQALVTSSVVQFDMSDQTPQSFGGQAGADEWRLLTDFVAHPGDPAGTAAALEAAATKDYGSRS